MTKEKQVQRVSREEFVNEVLKNTKDWQKLYTDAQSSGANSLLYPFRLCTDCLQVIYLSDGKLLSCPLCRKEKGAKKVTYPKMLRLFVQNGKERFDIRIKELEQINADLLERQSQLLVGIKHANDIFIRLLRFYNDWKGDIFFRNEVTLVIRTASNFLEWIITESDENKKN